MPLVSRMRQAKRWLMLRPSNELTDESVGTLPIGDRSVRRLGFGAMRIAGDRIRGTTCGPHGAIATLRRAVELGTNLVDTANSYGPGVSEEIAGAGLELSHDKIVELEAA